MILISAALVLAAIVLLIAGVVLATPPLVMWSIVVSILSAVCLLIGALLRRHELFPAGGRAADGPAHTPPGSPAPQLAHAGAVTGAYGGTFSGVPAHPVATPMVAAPPMTHHGTVPPQSFPQRVQPSAPIPRQPAPAGRGFDPDTIVLVIPGRKRFHLANCRQLAGRDVEELTYEEAREEGFTPCTTCLPDLTARAAGDPEEALERQESPRATAGPMTATAHRVSAPAEPGRSRPAAAGHEPGGPKLPTPAPDASAPGRASSSGTAPATGGASSGAVSAGAVSSPAAPSSAEPADGERPGATREQPVSASPDSESSASDGSASTESAGADQPGEPEAAASEPAPLDWFSRDTFRSAPPSKGRSERISDDDAPSTARSLQSGAAGAKPSSPEPDDTAAGIEPDAADTGEIESPTSTLDWFKPGRGGSGSGTPSSAPATKPATSAAETEPAVHAPAAKPDAPAPAADPDERDDEDTSVFRAIRDEPHLPLSSARKPAGPAAEPSEPGGARDSGSPRSDRVKEPQASDEPVEPVKATRPGRAGSAVSAGSASGLVRQAGDADSDADAPESDASGDDGASGARIPEDGEDGEDGESRDGETAAAGGTKTQPGGSKTKSGAAKTQASGSKTRSDSANTQSGGAKTQGSRTKTQASGAETQASGAETQASGAETQPSGAKARSGGVDAAGGAPEPDDDDGDAVRDSGDEMQDSGDTVGSSSESEDGDADVSAAEDATAPGRLPGGQVKVMVGTSRYHSSECPLISGMDDAGIEVMSRQEAEENGLTHCAVCRNE